MCHVFGLHARFLFLSHSVNLTGSYAIRPVSIWHTFGGHTSHESGRGQHSTRIAQLVLGKAKALGLTNDRAQDTLAGPSIILLALLPQCTRDSPL